MQDVGKLFEMAMELSREERETLADRLWDSLYGGSDPEIDAAWREEIARRVESIRNGTAKMVPWEEVRRQFDMNPGQEP